MRQTLDSLIACSVLITENFSIFSSTRERLRTPAVSIRTYCCSSRAKGIAILSLVVPGMSYTTTRSSPRILLINVDLPTLGRPANAILIRLFKALVSVFKSKLTVTACKRGCIPRPCDAEIA